MNNTSSSGMEFVSAPVISDDETVTIVLNELFSLLQDNLKVPLMLLGTIAAVYCSLVAVIRWKMSRNPGHPSNLTTFLGQLLLVLALSCCQKAVSSFRVKRFQSFALYGVSQYLATACMLLTYDFRRAPNLRFASLLCTVGLIGHLAGVLCVNCGEIELGKFPIFLGLYVYGAGATFIIMSRMRGVYSSHIKCKRS